MQYEVCELTKLSLDILIKFFSLGDYFVEMLYFNINKNNLANVIVGSLNLIKDSYRISEICQKYLYFINVLTIRRNPVLIEIFKKITQKKLILIEYSNKMFYTEIQLCTNLYENFPLEVCLKLYSENYEIKLIIYGLESEDFYLKNCIVNLIKNIINRYYIEDKIEIIQEKFYKINLMGMIENNLITSCDELNNSILDVFNTLSNIEMDTTE